MARVGREDCARGPRIWRKWPDAADGGGVAAELDRRAHYLEPGDVGPGAVPVNQHARAAVGQDVGSQQIAMRAHAPRLAGEARADDVGRREHLGHRVGPAEGATRAQP